MHKACYNTTTTTTYLLPLIEINRFALLQLKTMQFPLHTHNCTFKTRALQCTMRQKCGLLPHIRWWDEMQPPGSRVGWSASHWAAQSAGKSRGGTSKNINYPNFGQVGKQISFRELWRRIKFLSTTFAFSASNCGALGAARNTKDFSPLCYFNSDELFVWAMVPLLY